MQKKLLPISIFLVTLLLAIPLLESGVFVKWKGFSKLVKLSSQLFIFSVSILYIALSFKKVTKWNIAFTQFIRKSYPLISLNTIISIIMYITFNLLNIINILEFSQDTLILMYTYFYVSVLYFIVIVFYILYFAGNQKWMTDKVIKLFDDDPQNILIFIEENYNGEIIINDYYDFLSRLKIETLAELYNLLKEEKILCKLEEVCIWQISKNNIEEARNLLNQERNYLVEDSILLNYHFLLTLGIKKLTMKERKVFTDRVLNLIDDNYMDFSNINDSKLNDVYVANEELIDTLITYCLEKPNRNRERFLILLFRNILISSNIRIENNILHQNSKEISTIQNGKYLFYVKNGVNIKSLSYDVYDKFVGNLESKEGLEFLEVIRKNLKEYSIGIYPADYKKILALYNSYSQKVNSILAMLDYDSKYLDINASFLDYRITYKNIKYDKITDDKIIIELTRIASELKNKIKKFLYESNFEKNKDDWKYLANQIDYSNQISWLFFKKYYIYIFENINNNTSNLSYEFWQTMASTFNEVSLPISERIKVYYPNMEFILYDRLIREGRFVRRVNNIGINSDEKVKEDLSYLDISNINHLVSVLQHYIDKGRLPLVRGWYLNENIMENTISHMCEILKEKYKNRTDIGSPYNKIDPINYIKLVRNNLLKEKSSQEQVTITPISLKYETRTVFAALLKLLLDIDPKGQHDSLDNYLVKLKELLDDLKIIQNDCE